MGQEERREQEDTTRGEIALKKAAHFPSLQEGRRGRGVKIEKFWF